MAEVGVERASMLFVGVVGYRVVGVKVFEACLDQAVMAVVQYRRSQRAWSWCGWK